MIRINNEQIKSIQLGILRKFKEICEENNYKYYLFFGTLIGAIRHKGFVPWDDDIDIIMPREDYEKFITYCIKHSKELCPYGVIHYRNKKKYAITIGKFENKEYMLYGDNGQCCEIGVNIDIYPLDGVGNKKEDITTATKEFIKWKEKSKYFKNHSFERSKNKCVNIIRYVFFQLYEMFFDIWVSKLDRKWRKKKIEKYKYCGIPIWQPDEGSYFEKKLLGYAKAEFEGDMYPIPEGYDIILKQIYGDYMKLPPENDRHSYHIDIAYKL